MKKFLAVLAAGIMVLGSLAGCGEKEVPEGPATPAVSLEVKIDALSEEEFAETGTADIENPVADDFAKITTTLKMTDMVAGTEREINMPAMRDVITDNGLCQYWSGNGGSQNNAEEDFSEVNSEVVIYRRDVTDEQIKSIFDDVTASVKYTDADGQEIEEEIPFSENIIIEE